MARVYRGKLTVQEQVCEKYLKRSQIKSRTKYFITRWNCRLIIVVNVALLLLFGRAGLAAESEGTQHYKMLSTVEYAGKGQFRNQIEAVFTVKKQLLSGDKTQYFISANDFDQLRNVLDSKQPSPQDELSFVLDRKTGHLSDVGKDLVLLEGINNECIKSLKKVKKKNIGKTWKQSFDSPFPDHYLATELKFTLTAIQLKTKVFGEMIAVRALSEPFVLKIAKGKDTKGVKCRINSVYLSDSKLEDIYLSISVFEATTNSNGFKENFRHELATYKTDAAGTSVDLTGLGAKFERFARKVGLKRRGLKLVKESPLPQWVQYEGLFAAQVGNLCTVMACEGALDPVALVYMPADPTIALATQTETISSVLAKRIPGAGDMKLAVAPAFAGIGLGPAGGAAAGAAAGGVAGTVVPTVTSDESARSPSTP